VLDGHLLLPGNERAAQGAALELRH
jgi:hypothetical protein